MPETDKGYSAGLAPTSIDFKYISRIKEELVNIEDNEVKFIPKPNGAGFIMVRRTGSKILILDKTIYGILNKQDGFHKIFIDNDSVFIDGKEL